MTKEQIKTAIIAVIAVLKFILTLLQGMKRVLKLEIKL